MKHVIVASLVTIGFLLSGPAYGQAETDSRIERNDAGVLGALSPELISKIRQLAAILQQKLNDGQIADATIQHELQAGDVAGVIRKLGPDATRLLDEIKTSFQSQYSEESLALLLQALMGHQ